jgi:hypothetical protein
LLRRLADLRVLEVAIQPAQDRGAVAVDVEYLVALQVEVAVEGFGKHLIEGYQGVEEPSIMPKRLKRVAVVKPKETIRMPCGATWQIMIDKI